MESLNMQLQPFFEWLLRTTLQASLLICLILLLQAVLRGKLGVRWHYCLWLLLLVRMALPWAPQSRASLFNLIPHRVPQRQAEYARQDTVEQSVRSDVASESTGESTQTLTTAVAQDSPEATTATLQRQKEDKGPRRPAFFALAATLPLVWLAGALVLAVYVCASNFNLLRIVKRRRPLTDQKILDLLEDCKSQMGIRIILGIVTTNKVKSPALFGFVRPRLLLPEGMIEALDREELRYVFLHELAHLKRHDIYIGWLMSLLQVLHWFNPFVWLAFYRMRADRELACDALVLARTHSDEPRSYGRIIVSLLERFSRPQRLPGMAGILETKAQLKRRITMITKFKKNSYQWSPLAVILIIVLACVSLPDAKHTKASETSAARSPRMVIRRVWIDAADPYFMGAPSPDGKYISYVDWNTADLAIHELATGKNRRLTNEGWGKGRPTYSIFSPDSKYVACRWRARDGGGLRIIRLDGSERRFIKHPEGITILRPTNWSTDGKHILASGGAMWDDSDDAFKFLKILLVSVEDGDARVLKTIDRLPHRKRSGRFRMSLSPDGRYVAYSFPPADNSGKGDIWVFGTDGGQEIQLVEHPADDFVLAWSPDGNRIVFASDRTGTMGIWAIDVADGKPEGVPRLLKAEVGRFHPLGLTQDGSYYYGTFSGGSNVYTAAFDPQKGNIAAKPIIAVHRYEGSNCAPDWSPDGRYLACLSSGPGVAPRLIIQSTETGEVREITPELKEFNVHSLRWSADGRSLLGAGSTANGPWGALQIDVKTGEVTTIVQGPALRPESAPDGKAIYYVRNVRDGGRIVRHDPATGEEKELYSAPGVIYSPALSPDGREFAFFESGVLKVFPATDGEPRELAKVEDIATIAWTRDGRYLLYGAASGDKTTELWRIAAEGGGPQKLDLEMPYLDHIRFHPDGRQIAFTGESQKEKVEVWVMENFLPGAPTAKPEAVSRARAAADAQQTGLVVREVKIEQGEYGLSLSRDGKRLVYPKRKDGKTNLVVRDLASGEETQITDYKTGSARYPVFSPDGKKVTYTLTRDMRDQQLHIVSLETGEDRDLDQYGFPQDWSRDGRFILIHPSSWAEGEAKTKTLNVLPVGGGSLKELNVPSSAAARFSPDGKYVSYSRQGNIHLCPVDGGDSIQITDGSARDSEPIWSADGKMLFFLSPRAFGSETDFCGVSIVDGKAASAVEVIKPDLGGSVNLISLSETGRLLFRQSHYEICIYSTTVDPQTNQPTGKPVKLADGQRATWSPDGKRIAYRYGQVLHVMSADGSNDQEIIKVYPFMGPWAWAPDNDHIYMAERVENRAGIYSISISAKERRPVFLDPNMMGHVTCSPDGKQLAFLKLPASSGKAEIFTVNVDGSNLRQLTSNEDASVYYPAWSPDGKYIAFDSGPGGGIKTLTVTSVDDGTSREVFRGDVPAGPGRGDRFFWASWSPDASKIAWTSSGEIRIGQVSDGKYETFKVDIGASAKSTFHVPRWSADGTKMLFTAYANIQHLMLMDNFLPQADKAKVARGQ